jgi:hypothetical protein
MAHGQQAGLIVWTAALLVGCIGPTDKPEPLAPSSGAADTQLVLRESYWATMDAVVVHLPYGAYPAAFEDERGVYYRAPYPIKTRWLFGSERLVDGGIYMPSSPTERGLGWLWVYLVGDEGAIETHLLPGEIGWTEGSLWRIEPIVPIAYQVRADCLDAAANGRYELLLPDGTIEITGSFVDGSRDGLFNFYRSSGEKVAEVPYVRDRISGTVRLWFGPEYGSAREKLSAEYLQGRPEGITEGWHPDGSVRERSTYLDGALESTEIRDAEGRRFPDPEAREVAESLRDADRVCFEALAKIVDENPPSCAPG